MEKFETTEALPTKARSYANIVAARDLDGLIGKMKDRADNLDENRLAELRPILSNDELTGLTFRLKASISAICEMLNQQ